MKEPLERLKLIFKEAKFISPNNFLDFKNTTSNIELICSNSHRYSTHADNILYGRKTLYKCKYCCQEARKHIIDISLDNIDKKQCVYCKEIKFKSEFGKLSRNKDGLRNVCKICRRKQDRQLTLNDVISKRSIQMERTLRYIKKHPFRLLLSRAIHNHKHKGFVDDFNLTEEYLKELYFKQNKKCYWTNILLDINKLGKNDLNSMSLDRLDCDKGYIKENVVLCIKFINLGRGNTDKDVFKNFINKYFIFKEVS